MFLSLSLTPAPFFSLKSINIPLGGDLKREREYYEQLYVNKFDNFDDLNKILRHKLPKFTEKNKGIA